MSYKWEELNTQDYSWSLAGLAKNSVLCHFHNHRKLLKNRNGCFSLKRPRNGNNTQSIQKRHAGDLNLACHSHIRISNDVLAGLAQ